MFSDEGCSELRLHLVDSPMENAASFFTLPNYISIAGIRFNVKILCKDKRLSPRFGTEGSCTEFLGIVD